MASRRTSWRRGSTHAHFSRPQKHSPSLPFTGVEDIAVTTMLTALLAKTVTVNATDGAVYTGLFAGTERSQNKPDLFLLLRYAEVPNAPATSCVDMQDVRGSTAARLLIPVSHVTTVTAAPLDTLSSSQPSVARRFATDTQISRGTTGAGRQLKRFDDFADLQPSSTASPTPRPSTVDEQTFGDLAVTSNKNGKWDQFQVNHQKFGVKTSFDENEYTTKIDRHGANFAERQREAARLAMEIEKDASENVHMREERNQELDTDFDEEARYSGVHRPSQDVRAASHPEPARPPERPKLSYAAAAAANARQPGVSTTPTAVAKPSVTNAKQAPAGVKEPAASAKAPATVPRQTAVNAKTSQGAAKVYPGSNVKHFAVNGKTIVPVSKAPAASQNPSASKGKALSANSKPSAVSAKVSQVNAKASPAAPASKSRLDSGSSVPTDSGSSVTTTQAPEPSKPSTIKPGCSTPVANKDRDATEKVPKTTNSRDRSSRENLPQLIKVRTAHTGRTSPNQSRNSPLPTPAAADTSAVGVLNLDAQTPNLGPEQIKRFEQFKTNREIQSIAANREKITDDLKKFSTKLDSRNGPLRRGQGSMGQSSSGQSAPSVTATSVNKIGVAAPTSSGIGVSAVATDDEEIHGEAAKKAPNGQTSKKGTDLKKKEATPVVEAVASQKPPEEQSGKLPEKAPEAAPKPKTKSKLKLNPNAQEFKFNPDAPSFKPSTSSTAPQPSQAPPQAYNHFPQGNVGADFSQPMQAPPHQGYPLPIQTVAPMPYGGQPYMIIPAMPAQVAGAGGSGFQYIQGAPAPASFAPAHVAGRFPQQSAVPVSYGYPQVSPIVVAQPQQRVPSSPYNYYSGPFPGGQGGAPHMTPHPQPHIYNPHQGGPGHMQGAGVSLGGRGGHGNARRGNQGKSRGKQYGQPLQGQSSATSANVERVTPKSPQSNVSSDVNQR